MQLNTQITYCYRDASNYKFWGEFAVEGVLDMEELASHLFEGEWFVPERVGLKHLLTEPWSDDDHILHEFREFESTKREDCICTAAQLIERFETARRTGWFRSG